MCDATTADTVPAGVGLRRSPDFRQSSESRPAAAFIGLVERGSPVREARLTSRKALSDTPGRSARRRCSSAHEDRAATWDRPPPIPGQWPAIMHSQEEKGPDRHVEVFAGQCILAPIQDSSGPAMKRFFIGATCCADERRLDVRGTAPRPGRDGQPGAFDVVRSADLCPITGFSDSADRDRQPRSQLSSIAGWIADRPQASTALKPPVLRPRRPCSSSAAGR